jgi:hypothetical protein
MANPNTVMSGNHPATRRLPFKLNGTAPRKDGEPKHGPTTVTEPEFKHFKDKTC